MDWLTFAQSLLSELGVPDTPANESALLTWFRFEQNPASPNAAYNPLNIQAGDFPHVSTSGTGQYDFASLADGVAQTAAFIRQPYYTDIVAALGRGDNAIGVLDAVQQSPWAESHYAGQLTGGLTDTLLNWATYAAGLINGTPSGAGGSSSGGGGSSTSSPGATPAQTVAFKLPSISGAIGSFLGLDTLATQAMVIVVTGVFIIAAFGLVILGLGRLTDTKPLEVATKAATVAAIA